VNFIKSGQAVCLQYPERSDEGESTKSAIQTSTNQTSYDL